MKIGVTGIFGSGKSTVAKLIAQNLGYKRIDADEIADKVFRENDARIRIIFGTSNKKQVSKIVFDSPEKLKKLQEIIHPAVLAHFKNLSKDGKNYVFDIPLLFETNAHNLVDKVIVVKSSEYLRIRRLKEKGFSSNEIEKRTSFQMPISEKLNRGDFVITNDDIEHTKKQVDEICKILKK